MIHIHRYPKSVTDKAEEILAREESELEAVRLEKRKND